MGYVKTAAEIDRMRRTLTNPRFTDAQAISVEYLTEPEVVARLLPPGLAATERPVASVRIGRWRSNCVGDFSGAALYLRARHDGREGDYVVGMWMSTGPAVTFGREVLGEPKKLGEAFLTAIAGGVAGWAARGGTPLIRVSSELGEDVGPASATGLQYTFKARPAADGSGLEEDALLVETRFDRDFRVQRRGTASVELRAGPQDPVDEIPVLEVERATYTEGDFSSSSQVIATVPAETFLPYALGGNDDWSALDTT